MRHKVVQLLHRQRAALAAGRALPGGDRGGVVAVAARLARADGHRPAAVGAEADAGEQGRSADHLRRRHLRVPRAQLRLHGVERLLIDEARHGHGDHLIIGLVGAVLGAAVELVDADVAGPGPHPVDGADAPAPAGPRVELAPVQVLGDRLDAMRPDVPSPSRARRKASRTVSA